MHALRWSIVAVILALMAPAVHAGTPAGYTYYSIGDVAAKTPGRTATGLMLMGGGGWPHDGWRWFLARAGNGHIVVLRASGGGEAGEEIYKDIGGAASVETLVFDDRKASSDPKVLAILAHADGIFIAGGDQANYVRYWKDSPVAKALDAHVARGRPIGGTSAGLAILGGTAYGAMDGGSVDSITALGDPMGPAVTMVHGFLHMPFLAHIVTDTHFNARDRLGRLIAFVAQTRASGDAKAIGIGVDEKTALCVDADGSATLHTLDGGHAWLVEPQGAPGATAGRPLDWAAVKVTGIGTDGTLDLRTLKVTSPAFGGTASVKAGRLTDAPFPPNAAWSLVIHGGAGVVSRGDLTPEQDKTYRQGLSEALAAGSAMLRRGGSSVDAVEAALRVLEDNPLFNAGRGAVFDAEGKNQLDAAIMDGATLRAGAVAGVSATKNPVTLARAVMEHSRHVLLTGSGADQFAREQGVEQVDPGWFRTEKRWQEYLEWKRDEHAALDPTHRFGTVGAVALDMRGHVAAATSTGGLTGKRWGRIGDSPIIGAGTYAADRTCAVSATGTGEYFIRESAARQVCDRIAWKGQTVRDAASDTIEAIGDIGGDGGLIAIDGKGHAAFAMNTEGMYRGLATSTAPARTAIYADEPIP
ncbi:MAG: isoaspartyl peptidase/L-asparaginase [Pseudomonadota bacterium]|jgi:beta-aspartyl-peptidase (threonine type)|uniref:Isoaspartyl aminopeptidase @ Asp-X dipeptidase n=1 Tax=hydrothermal vent metagenome TaxID=652676 RepID=A0A160TPK9_9ZZZZ